MKQPYVVVSQRNFKSLNTGRNTTEIIFRGIQDRCEYKTYVEEGMKNYSNWQHIISNPQHGFVLNNLTVKDLVKGLITADSRPIIECEMADPELILKEINEFWEAEDAKNANPATTFRQLFEEVKPKK